MVRSSEMGEFTAVHKIMRCRKHGTIFRSERLKSIVNPHCIYANDVILDSPMDLTALRSSNRGGWGDKPEPCKECDEHGTQHILQDSWGKYPETKSRNASVYPADRQNKRFELWHDRGCERRHFWLHIKCRRQRVMQSESLLIRSGNSSGNIHLCTAWQFRIILQIWMKSGAAAWEILGLNSWCASSLWACRRQIYSCSKMQAQGITWLLFSKVAWRTSIKSSTVDIFGMIKEVAVPNMKSWHW